MSAPRFRNRERAHQLLQNTSFPHELIAKVTNCPIQIVSFLAAGGGLAEEVRWFCEQCKRWQTAVDGCPYCQARSLEEKKMKLLMEPAKLRLGPRRQPGEPSPEEIAEVSEYLRRLREFKYGKGAEADVSALTEEDGGDCDW